MNIACQPMLAVAMAMAMAMAKAMAIDSDLTVCARQTG